MLCTGGGAPTVATLLPHLLSEAFPLSLKPLRSLSLLSALAATTTDSGTPKFTYSSKQHQAGRGEVGQRGSALFRILSILRPNTFLHVSELFVSNMTNNADPVCPAPAPLCQLWKHG